MLEGAADSPVWIDIRDDKVAIRDARKLWGLDTWEPQSLLWKEVSGRGDSGSVWTQVSDQRWTTQRAAVLAIGPAGEKLSRISCVMHEKGRAFGQGGFGAVWSHKKLKATSVIGAKSVPVADPDGLVKAWRRARERYTRWPREPQEHTYNWYAPTGTAPVFWPRKPDGRPKACYGCFSGCHAVYADGKGSEGKCLPTMMYMAADSARQGKITDATYIAVDELNRPGLNAREVNLGMLCTKALFDRGELGPGKRIPCSLPFDKYRETEFAGRYMEMISQRQDLGDDLAEGLVRAANNWGRAEEDWQSGLLNCAYWGYPNHFDPRTEVDWGYGSLVSGRDINEHEVNSLFWAAAGFDPTVRKQPLVKAEEAARILAAKRSPGKGDPGMSDSTGDNLYSDGLAAVVAWRHHFSRFWRESALFCDFRWSEAINTYAPANRGVLAEAQEPFFAAVTGRKMNIAEGVELGRKIWNLDNAVWVLQGRRRDMVRFPEYLHRVLLPADWPPFLPGRENGRWTYIQASGRRLDKAKVEEWKTKHHRREGWDPATGWPARKTLEGAGLANVAGELERRGNLGKG